MDWFKKKSKYRVVRETKEGYYDLYHVQEKDYFIFPYWERLRSFDTKKQAFAFIKMRELDEATPIKIIVEKEHV